MVKQIKKLTHEERKEIEKLLKQGRSLNFICFHLKRSKVCIQGEVKKNGGRDLYDSVQAQNRANLSMRGPPPIPLTLEQISIIKKGMEDGKSIYGIAAMAGIGKRKATKYILSLGGDYDPNNLKKLQRTGKEGFTFEERIESLEQQVEILTEKLRNM